MNRQQYEQAVNNAYESGRVQGRQEAGQNLDLGIQQTVKQLQDQFEHQLRRTAGGLRKEIHANDAHLSQKLSQLAVIANSIDANRSGGGGGTAHGNRDEGNTVREGMIRIEDIPGRRVPFTLLVDIAIGANTTSVREASVTISQEGPFVAVKRMAIFQSAMSVQTTDPVSGALATFAGRSFGRYRPISSSFDIVDSQHNGVTDNSAWFLAALAAGVAGDALPSAGLALPTNMSSFRTMEFDGRIEVINAGSSYPRQNISVPSAFWSTAINAPWDLGSLDFFERGEVLTVKVQPLHVNNPPAGNVNAACAIPLTFNGNTGWPFLDGQYDAHEGICTPAAATVGGEDPNLPNVLATDSVQRLPDGILTIGWEGYRIIQPIGPAV